MKDLKAKNNALDELIEMCESAIAGPTKNKRMSAIVIKPEAEGEDVEAKEPDSLDKKAKISSMLDEMDEEELMELYSKLEG